MHTNPVKHRAKDACVQCEDYELIFVKYPGENLKKSRFRSFYRYSTAHKSKFVRRNSFKTSSKYARDQDKEYELFFVKYPGGNLKKSRFRSFYRYSTAHKSKFVRRNSFKTSSKDARDRDEEFAL